VLYSNGRLLPANVEADRTLHEVIAAEGDRSAELNAEFLDYPEFGGEAYAQAFTAFLRGKYAQHPPDVLVAAGADALDFLLQHRADLYPRVPVVHLAVSRSYLRSIPPPPDDVVGVPVDYDFLGTVEQALRWHPEARRLVVVTGSTEVDRGFESRLREEASHLEGRVKVEFLAGLPVAALVERLHGLGGGDVVYTPGFFRAGNGPGFTPQESAVLIAGAAAAPVYGPYNTFLGTGVVGGRMATFDAMARQAGRTVVDILFGAEPASLRLPETMPTHLVADWRQLRRWGIAESEIPGDAVILFRAPTFLEEHRAEVAAVAAVLLLQAALIAGLLVERQRRRQAEQAVNAQRFELAHASRLAVAGELTASIAHEINQPLAAILSNAEAAELLLDSGADHRSQLREILADIRRDDLRAGEVIRRLRALLAGRAVERRPFELNEVVSDAERVLLAEAMRRQVGIDVQLAPQSMTMVGDPIQIQQVVINLVLNAMDAVAEMPESRRAVVVTAEKGGSGVTITVRDRGDGIAPEDLPRLFDPFFSTKRSGMGLGLPIARTIVEAHGGRIWCENGTGEGAVFRAELPAAAEASKEVTA
jgi:signal transduction histidine kinase